MLKRFPPKYRTDRDLRDLQREGVRGTAGVGFQLGAERVGAMAIPSGPGNLELQCNFLIDLETTVLCCTASMGLLLAEEVHARGLRGRLHLKKVILGAERTGQARLHTLRDLPGGRAGCDIPG